MEQLFVPLFGALLLASFVLLVRRARQRAAVGSVVAAERPSVRARRVALVVLALLALAVAIAGAVFPRPVAWFVLMAAGQLLVLSPGPQDAVLGSDGVQYGWHARRFGELAAWRLTGEHLRFRIFAEWVAVAVPPGHAEALRARLTELCPEREDRTGMDGYDAQRTSPAASQSAEGS